MASSDTRVVEAELVPVPVDTEGSYIKIAEELTGDDLANLAVVEHRKRLRQGLADIQAQRRDAEKERGEAAEKLGQQGVEVAKGFKPPQAYKKLADALNAFYRAEADLQGRKYTGNDYDVKVLAEEGHVDQRSQEVKFQAGVVRLDENGVVRESFRTTAVTLPFTKDMKKTADAIDAAVEKIKELDSAAEKVRVELASLTELHQETKAAITLARIEGRVRNGADVSRIINSMTGEAQKRLPAPARREG